MSEPEPVICECDQGAFALYHRPYCVDPAGRVSGPSSAGPGVIPPGGPDLADEWTRWAWNAYGGILTPPVARRLAATGVRPPCA